MRRSNPITTIYLSFLTCLASFLVWFAEVLESLFGVGVRDGIIKSAHRRQDAFEEFDATNSSFPTVNAFEPTEDDVFPLTSQSGRELNSSIDTDNISDLCSGHVPVADPVPNGSIDIKTFDPYDPHDPLSVFNGDPLNFDRAFHADSLGNN